jgi:AcrR family transcriptional regulator
MGVAERKARHKTSLRQEILEAAREMFIAEGYQNVSMRRIAEKIEYSPTTIYLYFRDKQDLLFHIVEDTFQKLTLAFEDLAKEEFQDPIEHLRRGLRTYVDFGLQNPNHYKLALMTHPDPSTDRSKYCDAEAMSMKAFGHLQSGVAACVEQGKFEDKNVQLTSEVLWAGIHGITALMIVHPDFPWSDRERIIDELIDRLIAGYLCK